MQKNTVSRKMNIYNVTENKFTCLTSVYYKTYKDCKS